MVQQSEFGWPYFERWPGMAQSRRGQRRRDRGRCARREGLLVIIEYMAFNPRRRVTGGLVFPTRASRYHAAGRSCRNVEAAKAFVDWQLSVEAARRLLRAIFRSSRYRAAEGYPPVSSLKIMPSDFAAMLANDRQQATIHGFRWLVRRIWVLYSLRTLV
jgi:hypothetical protein